MPIRMWEGMKHVDFESPVLDRVELAIVTSNRTPQGGRMRSEHGFALLASLAWSDETSAYLLFDTGASGEILRHNLGELGVSPEEIDWVVLSHCHHDHTGGLEWLLSGTGAASMVVAHPDITRRAYRTHPRLQYIGMDSPGFDRLEPARWLPVAAPLSLAPGVWMSGSIPRRVEFEQVRPHVATLREGVLEHDGEPEDLAVYLSLGNELVVLTGCSHAGPVNTVAHAKELFVGFPVRALAGGLHLYDAETERIDATVASLMDMVEGGVISGHCTGERGEMALAGTFGDRHRAFCSGDVWTLSRYDSYWHGIEDAGPR